MSNRDEILNQWKNASAALAAAKAEEAALRPQVIEAFSDITDEMTSGVENVNVGWGHTLKIERTLRYELDKANDFEKTDAALDEIEALLGQPMGELIVNRLVKRKLEISVTEYKKLLEIPEHGPRVKAIIDRVLTIKPGSASVKLEAPKTK